MRSSWHARMDAGTAPQVQTAHALITIKPFFLKQNIVETAACFRYAGALFRAFRQSLIQPGEWTNQQSEFTQ